MAIRRTPIEADRARRVEMFTPPMDDGSIPMMPVFDAQSQLPVMRPSVPDTSRSSLNFARDQQAVDFGGRNLGTIFAGFMMNLFGSDSSFIDHTMSRGEQTRLMYMLNAEQRELLPNLAPTNIFSQFGSGFFGGAQRSALQHVLNAAEDPDFDAGSYYDGIREASPDAMEALERLGWKKEDFSDTVSVVDFNSRLVRAQMLLQSEAVIDAKWAEGWRGSFRNAAGFELNRQILEDPFSLASFFIPLWVPGSIAKVAQTGGKALQVSARLKNPASRAAAEFIGHASIGMARVPHAIHHGSAMRIGYAATWAAEIGTAAAIIDALEQFEQIDFIDRVLGEMPGQDNQYSPIRGLIAGGAGGLLGGGIGGAAFGFRPRNVPIGMKAAFEEFFHGGQMSLRRSFSEDIPTRIALTIGDDNMATRTYDLARRLTPDDTADDAMAFLSSTEMTGGERASTMLWLESVGEAVPEGQRIFPRNLQKAHAEFLQNYRQRHAGVPNKHDPQGANYNAIRQRLDERMMQRVDGPNSVTAFIRRTARADRELVGILDRRRTPGTVEWENRLHTRAMSLLARRELRDVEGTIAKARRAENLINPRANRATQKARELGEPRTEPRPDNFDLPMNESITVPLDDLQLGPRPEIARTTAFREQPARIDESDILVERLADGTLRIFDADGAARASGALSAGIESARVRIVQSADEPPVQRLYETIQTDDVGGPQNPTARAAQEKIELAEPSDAALNEMNRSLMNPDDVGAQAVRSFGLSQPEARAVASVSRRRAGAWAAAHGEDADHYMERMWGPRAVAAERHDQIEELLSFHGDLINAAVRTNDTDALNNTLRRGSGIFLRELPDEDKFLMLRWARNKARQIPAAERSPQQQGLADMSDFNLRNALARDASDITAEEFFFDAFLHWNRTGQAPNTRANSVFGRFRVWMSKQFDDITDGPSRNRYHLDIENDFDRVFARVLNPAMDDAAVRASSNVVGARLTHADTPRLYNARIERLREEFDGLQDAMQHGMSNFDIETRAMAIQLAFEEAGLPLTVRRTVNPTLRLDGTRASRVNETIAEMIPETESGRLFQRNLAINQQLVRIEQQIADPSTTPAVRRGALSEREQLTGERRQVLDRLENEILDEVSTTTRPVPVEATDPQTARDKLRAGWEQLPDTAGDGVRNLNVISRTLQWLGVPSLITRMATSRTAAWIPLQSTVKGAKWLGDLVDRTIIKAERLTQVGDWTIGSTFQDGQLQAVQRIVMRPLNYIEGMKSRGRLRNRHEYRAFTREVLEHHYGSRISEDKDVLNFLHLARQGLKEIGQEGQRNGRISLIIEDFLPQRWNQRQIGKNLTKFTEMLSRKIIRKWENSEEILQETLVDMGWARRIEDPQTRRVTWEPTDQLPEQFGGQLPQARNQLGEFADDYSLALRGEGIDNPAHRRIGHTAAMRIMKRDHIVERDGRPAAERAYSTRADQERSLLLDPEDFADGDIWEFLDLDIIGSLEHYAKTTGADIRAHSIVQELPFATKGITTPRDVFDTWHESTLRLYQREGMDTAEVGRAHRVLLEKYDAAIGRAKPLFAEADTLREWAAQMAVHGTGVAYNVGAVMLSLATEGPRVLFGRAYGPAQLLDNVRQMVVNLTKGDRQTLLDFATGTHLYRATGSHRFLGETHVSPVSMSWTDRAIQPWAETFEAAIDTSNSMWKRLGEASVLFTRATGSNLGQFAGLNAISNRMRAMSVYQSQRELATFLPNLERLTQSTREQANVTRQVVDAAKQAARDRGASEDAINRAGQGALVRDFKRRAREAGFGHNWHVALAMHEAKLNDEAILPLIRRMADSVQGRIGTNPNRSANRPFMDVAEMRRALLELPEDQRAAAQQGLNRLDNYVTGHSRRFLNEPSPWTSATDRESRGAWGRMMNSFLSFAFGATINIGQASNQLPLHRAMGLILTYTLFEYMGGIARRITRGESPESILDEWDNDPELAFARMFSRWPGIGLYSLPAESVAGLITGRTPAHQSTGGAGAAFGAGGMTWDAATRTLAAPGQIVRGDDVTAFNSALTMLRTAVPGVGLTEAMVTGDWPRDQSSGRPVFQPNVEFRNAFRDQDTGLPFQPNRDRVPEEQETREQWEDFWRPIIEGTRKESDLAPAIE